LFFVGFVKSVCNDVFVLRDLAVNWVIYSANVVNYVIVNKCFSEFVERLRREWDDVSCIVSRCYLRCDCVRRVDGREVNMLIVVAYAYPYLYYYFYYDDGDKNIYDLDDIIYFDYPSEKVSLETHEKIVKTLIDLLLNSVNNSEINEVTILEKLNQLFK